MSDNFLSISLPIASKHIFNASWSPDHALREQNEVMKSTEK